MRTHNICFHAEIRKICGHPLLSGAMWYPDKYFSYMFMKTYVVCTHLGEVLLMSTITHFCGEIRKISIPFDAQHTKRAFMLLRTMQALISLHISAN